MERTTTRVSNGLLAFTSMDTNTIVSRTAGMEDLKEDIGLELTIRRND